MLWKDWQSGLSLRLHEAREDLIVDQFLQGLADTETRRHISLVHPSGVDQAVRLATEY